MNPVRSYIVRIYRQDRRGLAGTVEEVASGRATAFRSFAGLREVLTRRPPRCPGRVDAGVPT